MRKIKKKKKLNSTFLIVMIVLLFLFSLGSVGYASVMQAILSYEKFGVVFREKVFIPHSSAWWFLGALGFLPISWLFAILGE
jgi:hypothetical protein